MWDQQSSFGRMLDPIADKLLVASCLLMLAADGTISGLSLCGGFQTTAPAPAATPTMGRHPKPFTKAVIVNGLIKCENTLPVVLHANDRPAILLGFVV
jgi:hypothetical protein